MKTRLGQHSNVIHMVDLNAHCMLGERRKKKEEEEGEKERRKGK